MIEDEEEMYICDYEEQYDTYLLYERAKVVAMLHDVLEDTDTTMEDLKKIGFDDTVLEAVDAITRREDEGYFKYIVMVKRNEMAALVKKFDLKHNMVVTRLKEFTDEDAARIRKYFYSFKYLNDEISEKEFREKLYQN